MRSAEAATGLGVTRIACMGQPAEPSDFDPRRPFTRADLRASGAGEDVLASGRFAKIWWNAYVDRGVRVTPAVRARAALRHAPSSARISHQTAAELWGAPLTSDPQTHLTVPGAGQRLVRRGIRSHYGGPAGRTWRNGIPVSTPGQTFVELAGSGLDLVDLVVVGDALVAAGHITVPALVAFVEKQGGRGCRMARRAAGLVREHVDSAMETRLLLVLAGLPEPQVNLVLRGEDGSWERRFDLAYPALRLVLEYDGRQHANDSAQWNADIYRREELERRGWTLVTVTAEGIYREPARTLDRVRDALRRCGAQGLIVRYRPEWRLHFPAEGTR